MSYYTVGLGAVSTEDGRVIEAGRKYKIEPSKGYPSIPEGKVEVLELILSREILENSVLYRIYEDKIAARIESELEGLIVDSIAYQDREGELLGQPWVVYSYTDDTENVEYVLPIEVFIPHTI